MGSGSLSSRLPRVYTLLHQQHKGCYTQVWELRGQSGYVASQWPDGGAPPLLIGHDVPGMIVVRMKKEIASGMELGKTPEAVGRTSF